MRDTTLRIAQMPESPTLPRTEEETRRATVLSKVVDSCQDTGTFSVNNGSDHQTFSIRKLLSGNYLISPLSSGKQDLPNPEALEPTDLLSFQRVYQERAASSVTITPEGRVVPPNLDDLALQTRHEKLTQQIDRALESRHAGLISELIG